jgi:uncharacterized membrane protein YqjE
MPDPHSEPSPPSTTELLATTLRDARELAQAELELAREELRVEADRARRAAIQLAIAFGCAVLAVSSLVTSLAIARRSAALELALAVVFLAAGAVAGTLGWRARPRTPLRPTRDRIAHDVEKVKEHLA